MKRALASLAASAMLLFCPGWLLQRKWSGRKSLRIPHIPAGQFHAGRRAGDHLSGCTYRAPALPVLHMMEAGLLGRECDYRPECVELPEELLAMVQGGEHDLYAFPLTVVSTLYNKGLDVRLMNVNTWGVTYFMTTDPAFETWADLAGKTVYIPSSPLLRTL